MSTPPVNLAGGVRMLGTATEGTVGTAANPVLWSDNATQPNLRYSDGTHTGAGSNFVCAAPVSSKGDIAVFNGTNWFPLSVGSNTQVLTADSTQTTGLKWAAGGGGGSGTVTSVVIGTGLASTQSPLTTTGTMSIDQSFSPTWTGTHVFSGHGITEQQTAIGTSTTTSGILNQNTTASLVGTQQQYSPLLELLGHGWQAGGVNADQTVSAALQQRPQPGTASAATSRLVLANKYGGGAYADSLIIDTDTTNTTKFTAAGAAQTTISFGSSLISTSNSGIERHDAEWPNSDGQTMGEPTIPLGWTFSGKAYYGRLQTPTFGTTMNIDPSLGEHVKIVLTASLGAWTISAPPAGAGNTKQLIVLEFVQDSGGSRTIGTPPAIIKWLPTTYLGTNHVAPTLTTTANAKDYSVLVSDNDAGTFVEIYRNMNL